MSARASHVAPFLTKLALTAALAVLAGCELENPGEDPPVGKLYFPNALVLSNEPATTPRFLFVASTNFDLRYTSGVLHAFSLDALDAKIAECDAEGVLGAESCVAEVRDMLADEVFIPTYPTAIALDPDGERIVVASRTEDTLTVVDVDLGADDEALRTRNVGDRIASSLLGCDQPNGRDCGTVTKAGSDFVTTEGLEQPPAPSDVLIGRLSDLTGDPGDDARDYVATSHQRGAVSLYVDTVDPDRGGEALTLSAVFDGLSQKPTSIARDPVSGLLHVTMLGNSLIRLGVTVDPTSETGAVRLFNAGGVQLSGGAVTALRSVAFPSSPLGLGVGPGESQALLIANNPSALVLANVTPTAGSTTGRVQRIAEIGAGGAKLALGSVGGRPLAAVSCLDGRSIYIVDLTSMETRAVVPNLSGPYGVAFDEARERLYVTDFRSSVLRVVDLSQLASPDAAPESVRVIATVGRPQVVQELK